MAKRPQRRSGMGAASGVPQAGLDVVASPISTFVPQGYAGAPTPPPGEAPPPQPDMQKARDLDALSRSFNSLSDSLARLGRSNLQAEKVMMQEGFAAFEEAELKNAREALNNQGKPFTEAVEKGLIPPNQHPAFLAGWTHAAARRAVNTAYDTSEVNHPDFINSPNGASVDTAMGILDGAMGQLIENPPPGARTDVWKRAIVNNQSVRRRRFEKEYTTKLADLQFKEIMTQERVEASDILTEADDLDPLRGVSKREYSFDTGVPGYAKITEEETSEDHFKRKVDHGVSGIEEYLDNNLEKVTSPRTRMEIVKDILLKGMENDPEKSEFYEQVFLQLETGPQDSRAPFNSGQRKLEYEQALPKIRENQQEWYAQRVKDALKAGLIEYFRNNPDKEAFTELTISGLNDQEHKEVQEEGQKAAYVSAIEKGADPVIASINSGFPIPELAAVASAYTINNIPVGEQLEAMIASGALDEWTQTGLEIIKFSESNLELADGYFRDKDTRKFFSLAALAEERHGITAPELLKAIGSIGSGENFSERLNVAGEGFKQDNSYPLHMQQEIKNHYTILRFAGGGGESEALQATATQLVEQGWTKLTLYGPDEEVIQWINEDLSKPFDLEQGVPIEARGFLKGMADAQIRRKFGLAGEVAFKAVTGGLSNTITKAEAYHHLSNSLAVDHPSADFSERFGAGVTQFSFKPAVHDKDSWQVSYLHPINSVIVDTNIFLPIEDVRKRVIEQLKKKGLVEQIPEAAHDAMESLGQQLGQPNVRFGGI